MSPVDQGQTFRYRFPVKDSAGVLTNAGSFVVTITLPDGTAVTPTVGNDTPGLYDIAYTTVQAGLHTISGVATGGVLGTETDIWEDSFVVQPPAHSFIGVDEASAHLRAQGVITSDSDREQLRWLCIAASDAVERDLGVAIARRTVVETYDGGDYQISLSTKPPRQSDGGAISITTVLEDGAAVTDYTLIKRGWRLQRGGSNSRYCWSYGYENITVTYVTGCAVPPTVARRVAMNTIQTTWQASQQAEHPFLDEVARRASLATLSTDVLPSLSQVEQRAYASLRAVSLA